MLTRLGEVIGIKDPHGFRPLSLGRLNGNYVLASETCALDLVEAEFVRELDPGEIVIIGPDSLKSIQTSPADRRAFCIFEFIYFARPDSTIYGKNVYLTRKAQSYTLNTNGGLITPAIARRLKRKGVKLIALYGATAEVHDHITRTPGSFAAAMRGIAYMKEEGAGFTLQLVPLRDNYSQFKQMIRLAEDLNIPWRVGAGFLYLSANGDPEKNREIREQRLSPAQIMHIESPSPWGTSGDEPVSEDLSGQSSGTEGHFAASTGWPSLAGTHRNDYMGWAPTGRRIGWNIMDFWSRDGNLLLEDWVLIDLIDAARESGVDLLAKLPRSNRAIE